MKYNSIFHRVKYKEDRILFGRFITWNWPYIYTNKLHHRKRFVRILFTRCKTLETNEWAQRTSEFLKCCDSWIKIRTAHFLWGNLFIFSCLFCTVISYVEHVWVTKINKKNHWAAHTKKERKSKKTTQKHWSTECAHLKCLGITEAYWGMLSLKRKKKSITPLIIKITISSLVIGLKKAYFPLIRLPSFYRTVCYWIVCYWTVCYRTVQKANHIQRCSLKQPITFKVVITCACACFCVFAFLFFVLLLYFNANFLLFHNLAIFLGNCNFMINW